MIGVISAGEEVFISRFWRENIGVLEGLVTERDESFQRGECS